MKGIFASPNLHNKNITVIKLQEGNVFSRVGNSIQGMGDPCTGPRPRPHPLPVQGPGPVRWTCSNLFNLHLAVQKYTTTDCRKAGSWHSTEMPSC